MATDKGNPYGNFFHYFFTDSSSDDWSSFFNTSLQILPDFFKTFHDRFSQWKLILIVLSSQILPVASDKAGSYSHHYFFLHRFCKWLVTRLVHYSHILPVATDPNFFPQILPVASDKAGSYSHYFFPNSPSGDWSSLFCLSRFSHWQLILIPSLFVPRFCPWPVTRQARTATTRDCPPASCWQSCPARRNWPRRSWTRCAVCARTCLPTCALRPADFCLPSLGVSFG